MACPLIRLKTMTLTDQMLTIDPYEQTSVKPLSKYTYFCFKNALENIVLKILAIFPGLKILNGFQCALHFVN